ncbi:MAG: hypothetical protein KDA25_09240, partial [Phycisphaerales bacterium]|nr:hypothetical protein [Phycisphaerales bacterium]
MIRALLVRARIQLDVGSADRALADVMSVLRFAHMFEAAGGRPIEFALGLGVRAEALRIIESIFADAAPMSERSLARLLASLRQNDPRAVDAAHAWAVEYHVAFLTQLERLARRATPATMARELDEATDPARLSDAAWRPIAESLLLDRTLVDVPEIFHLGTDVHARLALAQLNAAPEPDPSLLAEIDRIRDVAGTHVAMAHLQWDLAAGRFAAGEVVTGAGMESIDGVAGWMFIAAALPHVSTSALVNARSEHRLLTVLVAIELFRHRQGRLPSTVGEVVSSGLLTEVPVDPWTGGAFVYRPVAGVVYSFGRDGVDGGGDASTDRVLHLTPSGIVR